LLIHAATVWIPFRHGAILRFGLRPALRLLTGDKGHHLTPLSRRDFLICLIYSFEKYFIDFVFSFE
jgi:hypothetical protein